MVIQASTLRIRLYRKAL